MKNDMDKATILSKIQEWEDSKKGQTSVYNYVWTFVPDVPAFRQKRFTL